MSDPDVQPHKSHWFDQVTRRFGRTSLSRRAALAGVLVGATGLATRQNRSVSAQSQQVLNDAVTAEGLLVTLLGVARTRSSDLALDEQTIRLLRAAQCEDDAHFNNLVKFGAAPTTGRYTLPPEIWTDASSFLAAWLDIKRVMIGLYLIAARSFGEDDAADLVELAFQIGTVEAQHYALLRQFAGERIPADRAFPEWQFASTSEAMDTIAGFGFLGGEGEEVAYPGPGDRYCRGISGLVAETTRDQSPPDITPDPDTASPVSSEATPSGDATPVVATPGP